MVADIKKQVITREIIEEEIILKKRKHFQIAAELLIPVILYLVYYVFVIVYRTDFLKIKSVLEYIFFTVIGVILVVAYVRNLCFFNKTQQYDLSRDKMQYKFKDSIRYNFFQTIYQIYFVSGIKCVRPGLKFFNIDDEDAFNEAKVGDDFFFVKTNNRIFCIFNTKYFELDENLQNELRT